MTPDDWAEDDGGSVSDSEWNRLVEEITGPAAARGSFDSFARLAGPAAGGPAPGGAGPAPGSDGPDADQFLAGHWAADLVLDPLAALAAGCRRLLAGLDRWLRKPPAPLTLPAGSQTRFIIGREPGCDMTLPDQTVSRWHASLKREDDGWLLTDLGSTNGTRLNGWRVNAPIVVSAGDLVSFGAATFVLTERPAHARR